MFTGLHDMMQDIRLGTLEVRLARDTGELQAAQQLRYNVFYEEMKASPSPQILAERRDFDALDDCCEHLLLIDHQKPPGPDRVVGTYRLIRREAAKKFGRFYSASEYDIACLENFPGEILELGRSCVHTDYRIRPAMQLIWQGLAAYMFTYDITLMFGCASFPGTNPHKHAEALSYLYYNHLAPPMLRARALPEHYVDMRMLPAEKLTDQPDLVEKISGRFDPRAGGNNLPPLIKGYLRVGAFVGDGAVVDHQFNTTDVC
ncbi:MAG: GNAT family N-acetyltransferase, partial [Alphaproteobacteria bacterium]|nr:GNAT family N-acetyltransferase [Alphaproteobacteria bacterium]